MNCINMFKNSQIITVDEDICYQVLPTLKYIQLFAYGLFYAWTVNLSNKKNTSPCSVFHDLILKFSAFDKFPEQMKE